MIDNMEQPVPAIFTKHEATELAYSALCQLVGDFPDVVLEEKKTCAHFCTGAGAFLGVHPRKQGLRLTLPLKRKLPEDRIVKCEQASARRFYNDVDLASGEIDSDLAVWIREAYDLKREPVKQAQP